MFALLSKTNQDAQCFLNERECLLDEVSLRFRTHYNTVDLLLSNEAQQWLAVVATMFVGHTLELEAGHSRNARRSRGRFHTWAMDLATLGLRHFADSMPCASWISEMDSYAERVKKRACQS